MEDNDCFGVYTREDLYEFLNFLRTNFKGLTMDGAYNTCIKVL